MILKSAILQKDSRIVYTGHRHHNIIQDNQDIDFRSCVQGFVDSEGSFLDRRQAYKIAVESGQVKNVISPPILTSEDLY
jgi:hypothetical protein